MPSGSSSHFCILSPSHVYQDSLFPPRHGLIAPYLLPLAEILYPGLQRLLCSSHVHRGRLLPDLRSRGLFQGLCFHVTILPTLRICYLLHVAGEARVHCPECSPWLLRNLLFLSVVTQVHGGFLHEEKDPVSIPLGIMSFKNGSSSGQSAACSSTSGAMQVDHEEKEIEEEKEVTARLMKEEKVVLERIVPHGLRFIVTCRSAFFSP